MAEPLFTKPRDTVITAYDIYGNEHQRQLSNFKFRASVYGILREGTKVLLKRHPWIKKFDLPGGGVELDETIQQALVREFKEETGLLVRVGKLITVEDSFFTFEGEDAHGILIFYEVEKVSGKLTTNDEDSAEIKYFEIDSLNEDIVHRSCWNVLKEIKTL
jgi:ADP-ribose pyrophosphatase YjhB (NUDIX family)